MRFIDLYYCTALRGGCKKKKPRARVLRTAGTYSLSTVFYLVLTLLLLAHHSPPFLPKGVNTPQVNTNAQSKTTKTISPGHMSRLPFFKAKSPERLMLSFLEAGWLESNPSSFCRGGLIWHLWLLRTNVYRNSLCSFNETVLGSS